MDTLKAVVGGEIDRSLVMSSPANDDGDRRASRVPPWARDEQQYDARRLHDEIAAEVQRLKPARAASPPDTDFQAPHEDERARIRRPASAAQPFSPEGTVRGARRQPSIDPVPMQSPPKRDSGGATWGMVPRLLGAAVLSIVVTVFVMRTFWVSSSDRSVIRDGNEVGAAGPLIAAAQENTKQVAALPVNNAAANNVPANNAQANNAQANSAPANSAPANNAQANNAPGNNASEQSSGLSSSADAQRRGERTFALARSIAVDPKPEAQQGDSQAQQKPEVRQSAPQIQVRAKAQQNEAQKPSIAVVPESRVLDYLSREEIEALLKRGQELIAIGDISGGRLLLTRAAEAGDARASLAVAGTYDAAVLATLGVVGVPPDPAKARGWYARAAEQGSPEAARRLRQLAAQ
jgi:hypothetical protein